MSITNKEFEQRLEDILVRLLSHADISSTESKQSLRQLFLDVMKDTCLCEEKGVEGCDAVLSYLNSLREVVKGEVMEKGNVNIKINFLRQWLNEDRITDPKKMVTNEDILHWIGDVLVDSSLKD